MNFLKRLWHEEDGVLVSTEMVLASGLLVGGVAIGMQSLRDSVNQEMTDLANQVLSIDNTFSIKGISSSNGSSVAGSNFQDPKHSQYTLQYNN